MSFLQDAITLKLARGKSATDENYMACIDIKVPEGGRIITGGQAWFETPHNDDYFTVEVVDKDGIMGPVDEVISSYIDEEGPVANQGSYIPNGLNHIDINALTNGNIPAGLYLCVKGYKGNSTADTLRCNIRWGIRE